MKRCVEVKTQEEWDIVNKELDYSQSNWFADSAHGNNKSFCIDLDMWNCSAHSGFFKNEGYTILTFEEWKAEQESNGLTVVKEKDIEDYKRMGEKLYEGLRLDLVPSSQKELAAFTNICGVPCRGKGDLLDNDGFLWDIKTAASLKLREGIWYNMFDYRYDIQAMWYLLLFAEVKPKGFRFAVIEKKAPYDWVKLEVGMDILIRAKQHIKDGLESYKNCVARKDWPGYTKDIQTISLPPYLN